MSNSADARDMKLGLSEPLRTAVKRKFEAACKSGDLLFSETDLAILHSKNGVPFQLRYCPALAHKPKDNIETQNEKEKPKKKIDPFENPIPGLLIDEIPKHQPSHILVLNKYPVIHNHFILATKSNKPQTELLEEDDLGIAYACIKAWQHDSPKQKLFAFFNSGEHSGASQPHRHLQFLPVDDMRGSDDSLSQWKPLIEGMNTRSHSQLPVQHDANLPFVHFATPIDDNTSPQALYDKYKLLLGAALSATSRSGISTGKSGQVRPSMSQMDMFYFDNNVPLTTSPHSNLTALSYNLAMTDSLLAICPRSVEEVSVPGIGAGEDSSVSINGTILGGTLMVKDDAEWRALKQNSHLLDEMLLGIGFAWPNQQRTSTSGSRTDRETSPRESRLA